MINNNQNSLDKTIAALYAQVNDEWLPCYELTIYVTGNTPDEDNIWAGDRAARLPISVYFLFDESDLKPYIDLSNFELKNSRIKIINRDTRETLISNAYPIYVEYAWGGDAYVYFLAGGKFQSVKFPARE